MNNFRVFQIHTISVELSYTIDYIYTNSKDQSKDRNPHSSPPNESLHPRKPANISTYYVKWNCVEAKRSPPENII